MRSHSRNRIAISYLDFPLRSFFETLRPLTLVFPSLKSLLIIEHSPKEEMYCMYAINLSKTLY